jgi:hypothetical protein
MGVVYFRGGGFVSVGRVAVLKFPLAVGVHDPHTGSDHVGARDGVRIGLREDLQATKRADVVRPDDEVVTDEVLGGERHLFFLSCLGVDFVNLAREVAACEGIVFVEANPIALVHVVGGDVVRILSAHKLRVLILRNQRQVPGDLAIRLGSVLLAEGHSESVPVRKRGADDLGDGEQGSH